MRQVFRSCHSFSPRIPKMLCLWTLGSGGKKFCEKLFFCRGDLKKNHFEQNCSNLRPFLFITFPQGFQISIKFGHWTFESGSKKTVKQSEKVVRTKRQTGKQPQNMDILTYRKNQPRGPIL